MKNEITNKGGAVVVDRKIEWLFGREISENSKLGVLLQSSADLAKGAGLATEGEELKLQALLLLGRRAKCRIDLEKFDKSPLKYLTEDEQGKGVTHKLAVFINKRESRSRGSRVK